MDEMKERWKVINMSTKVKCCVFCLTFRTYVRYLFQMRRFYAVLMMITLCAKKRRIEDTRVNSYADVMLTNREPDYLTMTKDPRVSEGLIDVFDYEDYLIFSIISMTQSS
jgi:hypothetical protein